MDYQDWEASKEGSGSFNDPLKGVHGSEFDKMRQIHRENAEHSLEFTKLAQEAGIDNNIQKEFYSLLLTDENFGKGFEAY